MNEYMPADYEKWARSSPLNKTKRNRYQPPRFVSIYNMFPFHIHRIWSTPKTILGIDNFNQKSFHRLAPFFSVTKVDAINICWLCVVKGSILCVFYDMEKKILFVYCHLADYPGGKVSYGDALANNKTNNCCSPFAAKNRSFIIPPPLRDKLSLYIFNVRNAIDTRKTRPFLYFWWPGKKN